MYINQICNCNYDDNSNLKRANISKPTIIYSVVIYLICLPLSSPKAPVIHLAIAVLCNGGLWLMLHHLSKDYICVVIPLRTAGIPTIAEIDFYDIPNYTA